MRVLELRGGDRSELSATLVAIERTERFTALRSLAMHGLAVLGVVLWLDVVVPGLLPGLATRCALALFALLAVGAGAALVLERRWLRIQRRLLATADRTGDPARG